MNAAGMQLHGYLLSLYGLKKLMRSFTGISYTDLKKLQSLTLWSLDSCGGG